MSPRATMGTSKVAELFWEATKQKRFMLQWCSRCERPIFYPRDFCPHCAGDSISWKEASGKGKIYAVSVMHKPGNPMMATKVPYAVAIVELEEGVRLLTNLVGCDPSEARVGMAVTVTWDTLPDGRHLPLFEPLPG